VAHASLLLHRANDVSHEMFVIIDSDIRRKLASSVGMMYRGASTLKLIDRLHAFQ